MRISPPLESLVESLSGVFLIFRFPHTLSNLAGAKPQHDLLETGGLWSLSVDFSELAPKPVNVIIVFFRHDVGMQLMGDKVDTSPKIL